MHRVGRDHRERRLVGALFAQVPGNRKMTANAMEGTPGICHLGLDCADGRAHRFSLSLEFLYSDNLSLLVAVKKKKWAITFCKLYHAFTLTIGRRQDRRGHRLRQKKRTRAATRIGPFSLSLTAAGSPGRLAYCSIGPQCNKRRKVLFPLHSLSLSSFLAPVFWFLKQRLLSRKS